MTSSRSTSCASTFRKSSCDSSVGPATDAGGRCWLVDVRCGCAGWLEPVHFRQQVGWNATVESLSQRLRLEGLSLTAVPAATARHPKESRQGLDRQTAVRRASSGGELRLLRMRSLRHDARMVTRRGRNELCTSVANCAVGRARSYEPHSRISRTGGRIGFARGHRREASGVGGGGWRVDSIPKNRGFFFADRDNDRVCVAIECFEPASSAVNWRGH